MSKNNAAATKQFPAKKTPRFVCSIYESCIITDISAHTAISSFQTSATIIVIRNCSLIFYLFSIFSSLSFSNVFFVFILRRLPKFMFIYSPTWPYRHFHAQRILISSFVISKLLFQPSFFLLILLSVFYCNFYIIPTVHLNAIRYFFLYCCHFIFATSVQPRPSFLFIFFICILRSLLRYSFPSIYFGFIVLILYVSYPLK